MPLLSLMESSTELAQVHIERLDLDQFIYHLFQYIDRFHFTRFSLQSLQSHLFLTVSFISTSYLTSQPSANHT